MTSLLSPAHRSNKLFISLIQQRAAFSRLLLLENGASILPIAHAKNLRARHNYFLSPGVYRIDFRSICFFPSPCYTPTPGHLHVLLFSCSVMSDSLGPRGLQPTRLLRPWDFPGYYLNYLLKKLYSFSLIQKVSCLFVTYQYPGNCSVWVHTAFCIVV